MKPFMDKDFLLSTPMAQKLYHEYAADMPIIDYHCHISPREIFEDLRYDNITQVWLGILALQTQTLVSSRIVWLYRLLQACKSKFCKVRGLLSRKTAFSI